MDLETRPFITLWEGHVSQIVIQIVGIFFQIFFSIIELRSVKLYKYIVNIS